MRLARGTLAGRGVLATTVCVGDESPTTGVPQDAQKRPASAISLPQVAQ